MNEHLPGRACQLLPCCKPPSQLKDSRHEQPSPWEPCPGPANLPEHLGRCFQSSLARGCTSCAVTAQGTLTAGTSPSLSSTQGTSGTSGATKAWLFLRAQGKDLHGPWDGHSHTWASSSGSGRASRALNPAPALGSQVGAPLKSKPSKLWDYPSPVSRVID